MITEDYVSFETAKLLVEKGFDLSEFHGKWAIDYDNIPRDEDTPEGEIIIAEWQYPLITIQTAMKWLRKKHEIFIRPNTCFQYPIRYYSEIFCYGDNLKTQQDVTIGDFESPEEACGEAVKYCLEKLI